MDDWLKKKTEGAQKVLYSLTPVLGNKSFSAGLKNRVLLAFLLGNLNYGLELLIGKSSRLQPLQLILNKAMRLVFGVGIMTSVIAMSLESNALLVDVRAVVGAIRLLNKSRMLSTPLRILGLDTLESNGSWVTEARRLRSKYMVVEPMSFDSGMIRQEVVLPRTREHSKYMESEGARVYLEADYYSNRHVFKWFLDDKHWKAGLTLLLHARLGRTWNKTRLNRITAAVPEDRLATCLACHMDHTPTQLGEVSHVLIDCPEYDSERKKYKIDEVIGMARDYLGAQVECEDLCKLLFGAVKDSWSLWAQEGPLTMAGAPVEIRVLEFLHGTLYRYFELISMYREELELG